jgi:hypothetical protein
MAQMTVMDSAGVPECVIPRLFDPFRRQKINPGLAFSFAVPSFRRMAVVFGVKPVRTEAPRFVSPCHQFEQTLQTAI